MYPFVTIGWILDMKYMQKVGFRDGQRKWSFFFVCVKLSVVVKLFQSFLIALALCNTCGSLKLMIFCIVISLSCVIKFISLCFNMLYFSFLHFKLQLWFHWPKWVRRLLQKLCIKLHVTVWNLYRRFASRFALPLKSLL